jgi:hypothetical protein
MMIAQEMQRLTVNHVFRIRRQMHLSDCIHSVSLAQPLQIERLGTLTSLVVQVAHVELFGELTRDERVGERDAGKV